MRTLLTISVLAIAVSSCRSEGDRSAKLTLPFIQDDFPTALAQAQERNLPLFVETWAPW